MANQAYLEHYGVKGMEWGKPGKKAKKPVLSSRNVKKGIDGTVGQLVKNGKPTPGGNAEKILNVPRNTVGKLVKNGKPKPGGNMEKIINIPKQVTRPLGVRTDKRTLTPTNVGKTGQLTIKGTKQAGQTSAKALADYKPNKTTVEKVRKTKLDKVSKVVSTSSASVKKGTDAIAKLFGNKKKK